MNYLNYIDERQPDEGVVISNNKIIRSHSVRSLIRERTMVPLPSMYYDVKRESYHGVSGYCYLHPPNGRAGFALHRRLYAESYLPKHHYQKDGRIFGHDDPSHGDII